MISWINDNMIVGPSDLVMKLKKELMKQFECDDCGELTEYIGRLNALVKMQSDWFRLY